MTTNQQLTRDGVVEIDEAQLQEVAGGASDYLLELDGVKGESEGRKRPTGLTATTAK